MPLLFLLAWKFRRFVWVRCKVKDDEFASTWEGKMDWIGCALLDSRVDQEMISRSKKKSFVFLDPYLFSICFFFSFHILV